ncbi:MAG: phosphatase PAP2 family protein [Patescibacteria group bacterium]|nr:phosphatase PAP2 family protein [Patescibacteria group bacterium]
MDNTTLFFQIFNLSHQSKIFDLVMVFGANYLIFLTVLLIMVLGLKGGPKERKPLFITFLGLVVAIVLIKTIHLIYFEPRPFSTYAITPLIKHVTDTAFPSEHTTMMSVIAFAFYYYKSKFSLLLLGLMIWVGFSRVFVGVHYPGDILGGMFVGLLSIQIAWIIKNWLKKKLTNL